MQLKCVLPEKPVDTNPKAQVWQLFDNALWGSSGPKASQNYLISTLRNFDFWFLKNELLVSRGLARSISD